MCRSSIIHGHQVLGKILMRQKAVTNLLCHTNRKILQFRKKAYFWVLEKQLNGDRKKKYYRYQN